ncbi:MAG: hypothetical protein ACE5F1_04555, partial [Planctomycetota bacterium]
LAPAEIHQPWDGFGNIRLMVRGTRLPEHVPYVLHPLRHEGEEHLRESEENETVAAIVVCRLEDKDSEGDELEECLQLVFPANTPAQSYALFANDLPTGLEVRVLSQLPEPVIRAGGLEPAAVKNHRPWSLSLTGRNFHPLMVVDLGEEAPKGLRLHVASSTRARLLLPRRFPRGTHRLRLNYQETEVELEVAESRWNAASPAGLKILRNQEEPSAVQLTGTGLPLLAEEEDGYSLSDAGGNPIVEGVVKAEEVLEERSHRLLLSPRLPRGRTRIHFGELDTGLDLHVSRQLTRKAWAVAASILVAALAIPGILIQRNFAPHIGSMDPQFVYSLGKTEVEITGAHLARVELIGPGQRAEFTLREDPDEPGLYHFTAAGLAEGKYRVRPIGPLYGASPGEHQLTVRSPILRIEPTTLHRLAGGSLRVDTSDDFDVTSLEELGLLRGDGSLLAELPVADGRIEIPAGSFQRADEGEYEIAIDGVRPQKARPDGQERSPLTLSIVGPRLEGVTPNPASLDSQGRIKLRLEGQHLLSDMWFGLVAEDGATRHALSSAGPDRFVARVPPGTYRLLFGTAEDPLEEFQGPALTVLPQPEISEVLPSKLTPGRTTRLTFKGTNLGALQRIVLKPVEAGHESLEIPLERGRAKLDGLESSYESAVTLQPGTYRIEPAGSELTIDVFDDCKKALAAFETGGDPQDLLRCLETGRPPQEVVKQAADLFFDRGLFAEARLLYQKQDDLRSRFRASFVGAYLQREPVAWFDLEADEEQALYGVAAMRLGWSGAKSPEFPEQLPLPWELEFVRGLTIPDPSVAVGAFSRAVREKTKACRGFEIKGFGPAKDALAKARLDLAIQLIRSTEIAKARALLEEKLLGDSDAWQRLGPEHQDLALFWHGHVSLWYRGDEKEATRSFQRATEPESGASLCRLYLDALRTESPGQEAAPEEASTKKALARVRPSPRDEWKRAFVRVFSLYKEITVGPNYNLLTERGEGYLTADERGKSIQLHKLLRRLEQLSPEDPFVHDALLYYLRNAQRITWPAQKGGSRAAGHGDRLRRISLSVELEPVRQYYLLLGELGPYAFPQITALPRSEHKAHSDRIREVLKGKLPAALRLSAERLRKKFLGLPVAWWNPKTEK